MSFHWSELLNLNAIDFAPIQLVSMDVFDTVLHRAVKIPSDLFKEVARKGLQHGLLDEHLNPDEFALLRIEMERKARKNKKLTHQTTEVTFNEIWQQAPDFLIHKTQLAELELATEVSLSFPNPYMSCLIKDLRLHNKKLMFTSDTYFSRNLIKALFAKAKIEVADDELLLSNEKAADKASGKLFPHLLALFPDIKAENILHLGDNLVSDFIQPQSYKIRSLYLAKIHRGTEDEQRQLVLGSLALENPLSTLYRLGNFRAPLEKHNFFKHFGTTLYGSVLASFCYWVAADAKKRGIRLICPIMREAQVFVPLIQLAVAALDADIEVKPLYTSRKAAFLPAMQQLDKEAIAHFFSRRHYSLKDLTEELCLPELPAFLMQYSDFSLNEVPDQNLLNQYLQSDTVQCAAKKASTTAREMLCQYARTVFAGSDSVAMVDLGPKGNTLSWLSDCLVNHNPVQMNYLLYSMPELAKNALKGLPYATYFPVRSANVAKLRMIHRCPEPLEILLTGRKQTTTGYKRELNGEVSPITQSVFFDQEQDNKLAEFEQGCLIAMQHLCHMAHYISDDLILSQRSREAALDELNALLELPTQTEALHLGKLLFDDNAGSSSFSRICSTQDFYILEQLGSEEFMRSARQQWGYLQSRVRWPQAVVSSNHPDFLLKQRLIHFNDAEFQLLCFTLVARVQELGVHDIVVYGGGKLGHQMVEVAEAAGLTIHAVVDSNKVLHGLQVKQYPILSLEQAAQDYNHCFLVASVAFARPIVSTIEAHYEKLPHQPLIISIAPVQS